MGTSLYNKIVEIGNELVKCPERCEGIVNSPLDFIPPRCLYLEPKGATTIDCVVIGMNPGKIDEKNKETKYYRENCTRELDYSVLYDYRSDRNDAKSKGHTNNRFIRTFLNTTKLIPNDSILWTELCKCQSTEGEPPLQTYRKCMSKYLNHELALVKKDTPLICAGKTVYRAMAFRYTEKAVIGIPLPSSRGNDLRRLINDDKTMENALNFILEAIENKKAVWISPYKFTKVE